MMLQKKILGFEYQKIIAIERCFDARHNTILWIEYFGDVALENSSQEIKHHFGDHRITSNAVDVWKTINNLIVDRQHLSHFSEFTLLTTSSVNTDSIFSNWNTHTPARKLKALREHTPSQTVKSYYNEVQATPPTEVKKILGKFKIESDQPQIIEKWEELKQHAHLSLIPDNLKDAALCQVIGLLNRYAIKSPNKWEVDINTFREDLRHSLSKFTKEKTPFPNISDDEIKIPNQSYRFVKEMDKIALGVEDKEEAIFDYLKSTQSQISLLTMNPLLQKPLAEWDEAVFKEVKRAKRKAIAVGNTYNPQQLYYNCLDSPWDNIQYVSDHNTRQKNIVRLTP